jgi:hypothetical protein
VAGHNSSVDNPQSGEQWAGAPPLFAAHRSLVAEAIRRRYRRSKNLTQRSGELDTEFIIAVIGVDDRLHAKELMGELE